MLRKNLQRTLLVLSLVFLFSLGVMAEAPDYLTESGFPIVTEPITIEMLVGQSSYHDSFDDLLVYQEYEKLTGIKIDWDMVPTNVLTEKRNLIITAGEYPEVFHSARFSTHDIMMYGEQGVFLPLNDLIENHAPAFSKLLEEYPDLRSGLTMPDGNIYALPRVFDPEFYSVLAGRKLYINQDFLDQLGMDEPETLDEFYEFLVAVRDNDLNGNGIHDEVPLGVSGDTNLMRLLIGSFGLGNKGIVNHPYVDLHPETGELRFIPTTPEYKAFLEFLNKLYKEELIAQDLYTVSSAEVTARAEENVYGVLVTTNPATAYGQDQYVGLKSLEGPYGDTLFANVRALSDNPGAFVITDKAKHPEAAMRWIDHFYSDEGAKLFFMGIEDITFEVLEDGSVEFTDLINHNPDGLSFTEAVSRYIPYRNGGYPAIVKQAYFKGSEGHPVALEAADKIAPDYPEGVWSAFNYTIEEAEVMASIGTDIDTYVTEMRAKFIIGQASMKDWDNYVRTIERMGLKYYMDTYEQAYERYTQE